MDATFVRYSTNWCKSFVGIDARQLYLPPSVKKFQIVCTRGRNWIRSLAILNGVKTTRVVLKTWSCHIFSESEHSVKSKFSTRRVPRNRLLHISQMAFVDTATLCLKQWDAITFTEDEVQRSIRKRDIEELRKQYLQGECYNVIEMYKCGCWKKYRTANIVKQLLLASSPYKMPLR